METAKLWQLLLDQRPDFGQLFAGAFHFKGYAAEGKKVLDLATYGKSQAIPADTPLNSLQGESLAGAGKPPCNSKGSGLGQLLVHHRADFGQVLS